MCVPMGAKFSPPKTTIDGAGEERTCSASRGCLREKGERKRLGIMCEDISGMHFRALKERNALLGTVQQ